MKILQGMTIFLLIFFMGCVRQEEIKLQGYIEGQYTQLSSIIAGKLIKLYVDRGQTVMKNQLMFQLDPEPELSQLRQAEANLQSELSRYKDVTLGQRPTVIGGIIAQREQAQADLDLAKCNFNRTAQLYQKGVVSKQDYDQSFATLKSNQQRVNQFEKNLEEAELGQRKNVILEQAHTVSERLAAVTEARWRLTQKTVRAPEGGLIFDYFFNEGEEISPNQPVVSLLAPRYVWLIFYIPEPKRAKISLNKSVTFTCDHCNEIYTGYINYISPQAEYTPPVIYSRESRFKLVYRVQARLAHGVADKIHPGQPVDVLIITKERGPPFLVRWLWKMKSMLSMLKA
jgi:HlyD family secretion protein